MINVNSNPRDLNLDLDSSQWHDGSVAIIVFKLLYFYPILISTRPAQSTATAVLLQISFPILSLLTVLRDPPAAALLVRLSPLRESL